MENQWYRVLMYKERGGRGAWRARRNRQGGRLSVTQPLQRRQACSANCSLGSGAGRRWAPQRRVALPSCRRSVVQKGRCRRPAGRPREAQQRQPPLQLLQRCGALGQLRAAVDGQGAQAARAAQRQQAALGDARAGAEGQRGEL